MLGFPKIRKNNRSHLYLFFFLLPAILLVSCTGTKKIEKKEEANASFREFLAKHEKTFDPSVYNPDVETILKEEKKHRDELEAARVAAIAPPETTQGYRVQILFTPEIDQANEAKDSLTASLPDDWCYIVYDAPYYKVRVGNYLDRTEANLMVNKLSRLGYSDAWIVPDKIIKNPPPKIPDFFIEPDRQPEPR